MNKLKEIRKKIIKCNLCGYEKETTGMPMGIIDEREFYGNHTQCPSGNTGTFYEKLDVKEMKGY